MSTSAWRSLNGAVGLSGLLSLRAPQVELDEPLAGPGYWLEAPGTDGFRLPDAKLGESERYRRVQRRDVYPPAAQRPILHLHPSEGAARVAEGELARSAWGCSPESQRVREVLGVRASTEPWDGLEFHPVMRRLLIWSPPPPDGVITELPVSRARAVPPGLQAVPLSGDFSLMEREISLAQPEATPVRDAGMSASAKAVPAVEAVDAPVEAPALQILGSRLRVELPAVPR